MKAKVLNCRCFQKWALDLVRKVAIAGVANDTGPEDVTPISERMGYDVFLATR
jgi:hypothetical protein